MKKVRKTYVKKLYPGLIFSDFKTEEVTSRDPLKIDNDGRMQGFCFFDIVCIVDKGETYSGTCVNYSNWYFFGQRLSLEEVITKYGNDPDYRVLIGNMKANDLKYVCHTQMGYFLPMETGDLTIDEVIQKEQVKKHKTKSRKKKNRLSLINLIYF